MATEWIDVVDTAVKIGLGALISSIATYKVASLSHKKEVEKTLINKKIDMISELSELAEEYFSFVADLRSKVGGMIKTADNAGEKLTRQQEEVITGLRQDLTNILSKRNKALSMIKILSINKAEAELRTFHKLFSDYYDILVFEKILITRAQQEEMKKGFQKHRNNFYVAIGSYISSIGA
jgi:hypothetical protein